MPSNSTTTNSTAGTLPMNVTFANPKASAFFVDGTTIPDVDFDAGPSCKIDEYSAS